MNAKNKRRSMRQRKKLHVAEFQELGFEYEVKLKDLISLEMEEMIIERFLDEVINVRQLQLGGGIHHGFVSSPGRSYTADEDREAVRTWLSACPEVAQVIVGDLKDAWYD
jgi:uncharacterized protein YggL (DUF469 family)